MVESLIHPIGADALVIEAFNTENATSFLSRVTGSIYCTKSVLRIEEPVHIILFTSVPVASYSESCNLHTVTATVPVVPVKFAESTALVLATKETIVVPSGIPVPVIVAPLNHPSVFATVIF